MKIRYQENYCKTKQKISYGESINISGVKVKFIPAGHILGSAQILLEYKGETVVISGDYKRKEIKLVYLLRLIIAILLLPKLHLHYLFLRILMINLKLKK